jgi:hypothetical protein
MGKMKRCSVSVCLLLLAGVAIYWHFRQKDRENRFDSQLKAWTLQIEHLEGERDSLYRALSLREQKHRETVDSLNAAITKIQTEQTQNRKQYENRRDSIVLMPDSELYRMVTGYIERYRSRAER